MFIIHDVLIFDTKFTIGDFKKFQYFYGCAECTLIVSCLIHCSNNNISVKKADWKRVKNNNLSLQNKSSYTARQTIKTANIKSIKYELKT